MQFLEEIDDQSNISELENNTEELINFVRALEMGTFYSQKFLMITQF